jgi:hypothetical protein
MSDEIDLAAKAIGESVGALAEQSGALGPIRATSEWITSIIHYRHQPALARRMMRAAEKVRATGIPPHAIADKQFRVILEAAAIEDDPSMQERWENLLAHAAVDDDGAVPPSFPAILAELDPLEATMLDGFVNQWGRSPVSVGYLPEHELRRWDSLLRLRLIEKIGPESVFGGLPPMPAINQVKVTQLGYELVIACREPGPVSI